MDVFSTELGIWLSFVKTSEFWGGFKSPKPPVSMPLLIEELIVRTEVHYKM
jgi:hypothetical protein